MFFVELNVKTMSDPGYQSEKIICYDQISSKDELTVFMNSWGKYCIVVREANVFRNQTLE